MADVVTDADAGAGAGAEGPAKTSWRKQPQLRSLGAYAVNDIRTLYFRFLLRTTEYYVTDESNVWGAQDRCVCTVIIPVTSTWYDSPLNQIQSIRDQSISNTHH